MRRVAHRRTLAFLLAAGLAGAASWAGLHPSSARACIGFSCNFGGTATYTQMAVSDSNAMDGTGSDTVDVWQNQMTGRITLQLGGNTSSSTQSTVITGTTRTVVIDGAVDTIDHYPTTSALWGAVTAEYGISQTGVSNALATNGTSTIEPSDSSASADSLASQSTDSGTSGTSGSDATSTTGSATTTSYSQPYMESYHYASVSALQQAIGFSVPQATALDGYSLIVTMKTQVYGPGTTTSGWVGDLEYGNSADPQDPLLSVDVATPTGTGGWGDIYKSMAKATPDLSGTGYAATLIGDNQAIFQKGSTYISVTTQFAPTTTEWQNILSTLAAS